MKWRSAVRIVGGIVLMLLGLLWILQGADVVRIQPILCVADCEPITGGSVGWLVAGIVAFLVGLALVALRRRGRNSSAGDRAGSEKPSSEGGH